jgi:hypothetical protein
MKRLILLATSVLLAACQTAYVGNENSPYYTIPVGSTLTLKQDAVIPPNLAGFLLQNGQILPQSQINQYYPYCKFEVLKIRDNPQSIQADTFSIVKVTQAIDHSVDAGQIKLAGLAIGIGMGMSDGGGSSVQTYATRLNLRAEKQPEVFRLSCGLWDYPEQGKHLTINEIRKALGNLFTLQLASGK